MNGKVLITPVARAVPFDLLTNPKGFLAGEENVQAGLESLRDHTIYISNSTATTLNGTLTLTNADKSLQYLTGTATGFSIKLPDATTLVKGSHYQIINTSNQPVNSRDSASGLLQIVGQNSIGYYWLQDNSTAAGVWVYWQVITNTATGIVSYNGVSSTAFNTTSSTDVLITGASLTPQAGTYAVWFNSTNSNTQNNSLNTITLYKAGSPITDSPRSFQTGSSNMTFLIAGQTIINVDGSQLVEAYAKTTTGTFTVNGRSLLLIRLGA